MTMPKLTREQRERLGHLIWAHVDGVAENVEQLIRAINADSLAGVRIVAVDEWERCVRAAKQVQVHLPALRLRRLTGPV